MDDRRPCRRRNEPEVERAIPGVKVSESYGLTEGGMVVLNHGAAATVTEIKAYCLEHGPKYAYPRFVEIVGENQLPLNGAGKIDRRIARDQLAARASGRTLAE